MGSGLLCVSRSAGDSCRRLWMLRLVSHMATRTASRWKATGQGLFRVSALVGFREHTRGERGGGGVALSVSQNASGWMLKKGYAVNGVAHTKHYEGVTAPCDVGGKGCSYA